MDPVLDRVRAANPADTGDFEGLADFDALVLDPPRRQRRRLLALPALGAVIAALVLVPTAAPRASEILRKASAALDVGDGILYARSSAETRSALDGTSDVVRIAPGLGARRAGDALARGQRRRGGLQAGRRPDARRRSVRQGHQASGEHAVPTEIFRAGALLESSRAGKDVSLDGEATVNGRPAYVLRWNEKSGPPHWPTIEMTLWVDKETFAPLRFTDHSYGKAVDGKPFDQTYTENVLEFKTLPDTPENRKLLELSPR